MKRKIIPIVVVVAIAALAVGGYLYYRSRANANENTLRVSGNIETVQTELSFRIAGWVSQRPVDESEAVRKSQLVASLDARELTSQVNSAKAQLDMAQAALLELQHGSRPEEIAAAKAAMDRAAATLKDLEKGPREAEIQEAQAAVERAQADADFRAIDYRRVSDLYKAKGATIQELDQATSALKASRATLKQTQDRLTLIKQGTRPDQIEAARQALGQAKQQYELAVKGPRQEQIDQAAARVDEAKATLHLATTRLSYATLESPIDGLVLSKNVEPGEYVTAGTSIVTVADLRDVYLRAYVNETDLSRVHRGQEVTIRTDTYPDKTYRGRVTFMSQAAEFTPKSVQTPKERVKLVYRIKVDIDNPPIRDAKGRVIDYELKPGMPADGDIQIGQ